MNTASGSKSLFIGLSGLSVCCLVGAFGNPLQKLEVWRQCVVGGFGVEYQRHYLITESDKNHPYGFDPKSAVKVFSSYEDYKFEKLALLGASFACALTALTMGRDTCISYEIEAEAERIRTEGKKELILEGIKHRLAMASKSQRLLFMDEMRSLISEFGSIEGEILEGDEVNATDKFTAAAYLLAEGHSLDVVVSRNWGYKAGTPEHKEVKEKFIRWQNDEEITSDSTGTLPEGDRDFRALFPESLDNTSWKAICKALSEGASRNDIVKEVLGCDSGASEAGNAYLDFLNSKFLTK